MYLTKEDLEEITDNPEDTCLSVATLEEIRLYTDGNEMRLALNAEFILTSGDSFPIEPTIPNEYLGKLRIALLVEEVKELEEAIEAEDKVAILDALIDIQYVLDGAVLKFGMLDEFVKGFLKVHENNMTKFPNGVCTRNKTGKIVKPEGFKNIDLGEHFPHLRD